MSRPAPPAARALALLAVLACLLAHTGCGRGAPASPSEVLERAISAQSSLGSVRMRVDSEFELRVPGARRSAAVAYDGVFAKPDRWRIKVRGATGSTEVVIVGDQSFVKPSGSDGWVRKQGELLGISSPGGLVDSRYLESASNVRLLDRRGDSYHLSFDLDVARVSTALNTGGVDPALFAGRSAKVEVWVREGSFRIERVTLRFAGTISGEAPGELATAMEVNFSDFDQPVSIEAPEVGGRSAGPDAEQPQR